MSRYNTNLAAEFYVLSCLPAPRVWIFPFPEIEAFKRKYKTRTNVSRAAVLKVSEKFENAWHFIEGIAPPPDRKGAA